MVRTTASRGVAATMVALGLVAAWAATAIATDPDPSSGALTTPGLASSPAASPEPRSVLTTCGRGAFAGLGVDAPRDAEDLEGPEGDAFRSALRRYADDFQGAVDWRVAGRTDDAVLFLGQFPAMVPPGWASIVVERTTDGWQLAQWGGCDPRILIAPDLGPADWWLDPAAPAPTADATQVQVLVLETRCSGGATAEGRVAAPVIVTTPSAVTITIGVRPVEGDVSCEANQPTPDTIALPEPLGDRQLLDGGHAPARVPTPIEVVEE